jgi:hypothetical protein
VVLLAVAPAKLVDAKTAGDRRYPGPKGAGVGVPVKRSPSLDEGFLSDGLGIAAGAQLPLAERDELRTAPAVHIGKRLLATVALPGTVGKVIDEDSYGYRHEDPLSDGLATAGSFDCVRRPDQGFLPIWKRLSTLSELLVRTTSRRTRWP